MQTYKLLDHTADIQIQAQGSDLPELFSALAYALTDYVFEGQSSLGDENKVINIELAASDHEALLVDWLSKLLYLATVDKLRLRALEKIEIEGAKLKAQAKFCQCWPTRDVKAITYHALKIEPVPEGVQAVVTLDI